MAEWYPDQGDSGPIPSSYASDLLLPPGSPGQRRSVPAELPSYDSGAIFKESLGRRMEACVASPEGYTG